MQTMIDEAYAKLDTYVQKNKIDVLISLFSGGGDSIATTLLASRHPAFVGCIHVNTKTSPLAQIASDEAVNKMERFGWDYVVTSPYTTFTQIVAKGGFPGAAVHSQIYDMLKGRPIAHAVKLWRKKLQDRQLVFTLSDAAPSDTMQQTFLKTVVQKTVTIGFVTGIRQNESQRRENMPYADKRKGIHWIAPLLTWTKMDVNRYLATNDIYKTGSSRGEDADGECDCRCFASTGERERKDTKAHMKAYREKLEELARVARELQLIEVEAGMRLPDDVFDETYTKWGWVADTPDTRTIDELPLFSICNDCSGQLTEDGRGGVDPDKWLLGTKQNLLDAKAKRTMQNDLP